MADADKGKGAIVVTGASTGIGAACAVAFQKAGYFVYAGVRKAEDAPPGLTPLILDVTNAAQIAAAADQVAKAGHPLRVLVNNAGIAVEGPLEFVDLDAFRRQFEVNVFGQLAVTQAFLPALRASKGRIINMSSIGGRSAAPFLGPYISSKFALEGLSDTLRLELASHGVNVIVVQPGTILTPIWEKSPAVSGRAFNLSAEGEKVYGEAANKMVRAIRGSLKRGIPPERVAEVVLHASEHPTPKARYLVGADAKLRARLGLLPDRQRDRMFLRAVGLA